MTIVYGSGAVTLAPNLDPWTRVRTTRSWRSSTGVWRHLTNLYTISHDEDVVRRRLEIVVGSFGGRGIIPTILYLYSRLEDLILVCHVTFLNWGSRGEYVVRWSWLKRGNSGLYRVDL